MRFDRVGFKHNPDGQEEQREVNFDVPAGQVVGVVGVSGAGKSTLARLIQRLYWPQRGRVLIDGVDLALVDPAWLRRQVAHVMQAAELTGAHGFILGLPKAYDTVVGERGAMLSGGELQRIVLALALVTDPRILILDEAPAALGYGVERLIQRNMARICAGRTVFIIAHRLSTLAMCDRILVLDEGRLVEEGTHDALLTSGGVYARLYLGAEGGAAGPQAAPPSVRPALGPPDLRWPKPPAPGLTPVLGGAAE